MTLRRPLLAAIPAVTLVIAAAPVLIPPSAAAAGTVRYAGPTGTGSTCSSTDPCSLRTAVDDASDGDEVVVLTGTYRSAAKPLSNALTDTVGTLTIHGEAGQPAPVIYSKAAAGISLGNHSSLSDVALIYSGSHLGLETLGAPVDHVAIGSTQPNATACEVASTLTDSVCVSTGANGVAYLATRSSTSASTTNLSLTGDTIVASGSGGVAVLSQAGGKATLNLTLTNTIAKGQAQDVEADSQAATAHSIITTDHCDYLFTREFEPTGEAKISGVDQVQEAPKFVGPDIGDFSELPGSPTINAGAHPHPGDTDLAGNPRVLGSAPDIGAYEHPQSPVTKSVTVLNTAKHTARVAVRVNPRGLPTVLRLTTTHGKTAKHSRAIAAGDGRTVKKLMVTLHGLARHTGYTVIATASNPAGTADTAPEKLHTR